MKVAALAARVLRSINAGTGALFGAVVFVAGLLPLLVVGIATGRLGPNQAAGGVFQLLFLTAVGAAFGALIGWLVHTAVSRSRFAGPVDWRFVGTGLTLVAVAAALLGLQSARNSVAQSTPRVIKSNGTVSRLTGLSTLAPVTQATLLYEPFSDAASDARLQWRGRAVKVVIEDETLVIGNGPEVLNRVSLEGLDYVSSVYGATAPLDRQGQWLALLVRLRATGRRELLLIYDPAGTLAHQELLLRTSTGPQPVLWSTGQSGSQQEFLLNIGEQLRYVVQE